ncbi:MAG: Crp/Fnr family transcriptional regulator [Solirubrobacterales bacterium]|nr:Crp/Fnr family transcriptional regulator [Solirubrobacterales bacterium]
MFGEPAGTVRLLDAEPSLARGSDRQTLDRARERLIAEVRRIESGAWEDAAEQPASPICLGYLILDGAFTREIVLSNRPSIELLGPGDLIRPWVVPTPLDAMNVTDSWTLLSPGQVAILDHQVAEQAKDFPSIITALMDRVVARSRWLGFHLAVCQLPRVDHRLLLTFRYAAERWGIEGVDGVKIPIRLNHRSLAALIGARRPSITSAIGTLTEQGLIERSEDGTWTFFAADADPMAILAGIDDGSAKIGI